MAKVDRWPGRRPKDVRGFIDGVYGHDVDAKRVDSVAGATLGVMGGASLAVAAIRQAMAQACGLVTNHPIKQVDRLLSNQTIDVWDSFARWVPHLIGAQKQIVVAMDWTDLDRDGQTTPALNLVTGRDGQSHRGYGMAVAGDQRQYDGGLLVCLEIGPVQCHHNGVAWADDVRHPAGKDIVDLDLWVGEQAIDLVGRMFGVQAAGGGEALADGADREAGAAQHAEGGVAERGNLNQPFPLDAGRFGQAQRSGAIRDAGPHRAHEIPRRTGCDAGGRGLHQPDRRQRAGREHEAGRLHCGRTTDGLGNPAFPPRRARGWSLFPVYASGAVAASPPTHFYITNNSADYPGWSGDHGAASAVCKCGQRRCSTGDRSKDPGGGVRVRSGGHVGPVRDSGRLPVPRPQPDRIGLSHALERADRGLSRYDTARKAASAAASAWSISASVWAQERNMLCLG